MVQQTCTSSTKKDNGQESKRGDKNTLPRKRTTKKHSTLTRRTSQTPSKIVKALLHPMYFPDSSQLV